MIFQVINMSFALPEIFMMVMACSILLVSAFMGKNSSSVSYWLTQFTLLITALIIYSSISVTGGITFYGGYIKDPFSDILKLSICIINIFVLSYSWYYLKIRNLFNGEYYALATFAILGMMIMVSSTHFITLYLGLELLSLCLYAMVAMKRKSSIATEAAMKYFILGALASGMLLYGMSVIYGATGNLSLASISTAIQMENLDNTVLSFGLVFLTIGIGFKFGAVPFHMWLPDVYHGAPTAVTLFISTAPKIAAFAMIIRLFVDGLEDLHQYWQGMLIVLAVLSMIIGNIVAIAQTNLKRMLAYSTISHVGFLLLGILSGTNEGYAASMFYVLIYALATSGSFGIIILMSHKDFEADNISDYKGMHEHSPWFAFMMLILMFSMAGIPPMAGFYTKLMVIKSLISVDLVSIAIIAVLMSVVGAFYYLRMIKLMYFENAIEQTKSQAPIYTRILLSLNVLLIFILGIFPSALMTICITIFS